MNSGNKYLYRHSIFFISMSLITSYGFAGGVSEKKIESKIVKIANFYAPSHPVNVYLREKFVPLISEGTQGRYEVEVYDSSSLGAERELTEGVRIGTIEMGIAGRLLSATYPKLKVLELSFMFSDYEHCWKVFDGPLAKDFESEFDKAGLKVLAWIGNGFRVFSNSVRPIKSVNDCVGIKMRMPENEVYVNTAKALDFTVVTMPLSEVFNALSTKVIDGQDNPIATLYASKFYEVQKYVAITNHIFSHGSIVINTKLWTTVSDRKETPC
ncbi:MAG: TRAP transporter substrate-binding protein [Spirochaetes bacterium]|nr:TRAP transporter substrate-binding protein [Spirochaetota bacterium]